jgi:phasin family protein
MTTITELKPTTSAMAADGFAAARQATDEVAARTRGLMQDNLKPAAEAFAKASSGATELGRGNLEAVAQSTRAYLAGMQDLSRQYVAAMLGLTRHALDDAKAVAGVRSLQDAMALQASLARASMERALGEGARLQQAALALAERVHAPLTRRATAALQRTTPSRAA